MYGVASLICEVFLVVDSVTHQPLPLHCYCCLIVTDRDCAIIAKQR